jgi:hypothetical protein
MQEDKHYNYMFKIKCRKYEGCGEINKTAENR